MDVNDIISRAGGQVKLAKLLNISQPAISYWKRIPVHHVLKIEHMVGINRHDMRPDIYPEEYK